MNGQTIGYLVLLFVVTTTIFFLWRIFHITFPHWKWREDHFGREIKTKLTVKEWAKVKKYRVCFFVGLIASFVVFGVLSYMNGKPY